MTQREIQAKVRLLVGSPDVNVTPNEQLDTCIELALQWLATKLKYNYRTDETSLALAAGVREYPLPQDVGYVLWAEWNGQRLTPKSTWEWERDMVNWRGATSARPMEFAVLGRTLTLYPPPDAGSITTDGSLHYRAICSAPTVPAGGPPGLSELDINVLLYKAATLWLAMHPSDVNTAMQQSYMAEIADVLPDAEGRANNPQEEYYPRIRPEVTRTRSGR